MNKFRNIVVAALAAVLSFSAAAFFSPTTASALTATATQTITINATAAAWEDGINIHLIGSDLPLRYIISNAIGDIEEVYIDGQLLDPSNYDIEDTTSDMTYLVIILHPNYLETLELGQHSLDVTFTNSNTNTLSDIFFINSRLRLDPPNTGFGGFLGNISSFFDDLATGLGGGH